MFINNTVELYMYNVQCTLCTLYMCVFTIVYCCTTFIVCTADMYCTCTTVCMLYYMYITLRDNYSVHAHVHVCLILYIHSFY